MAIVDETDKFLPLFPEETEATIRERFEAIANEGLTPEDDEEWVDTREGGFWFIATAPAIREAARIYDLMGTDFPAAAFPLWTWGEYMDDLAIGFDLERNAASFADGKVTFTAEAKVEIPAGTQVSVEDGPEFQTTEGTEIPALGGSKTVKVKALEAGSDGDVGVGAITLIDTPLPVETTVTNAEATVGGEEAESDEALRSRLLAAHEGKGPGNKRDYQIWGLSYGKGIGRVIVIPLWEGPGTVLVILLTEDGDPVSAETVEGFQAFIDPVAEEGEGEAPIGPTVTATTAVQILVDVAAKIEPENGYSLTGAGGTIALEAAIKAAVAEEINLSQPGSEIVRQKVLARIVSIEGVHDVTAVKLNGVEANIALDENPAQIGSLDELALTEGAV